MIKGDGLDLPGGVEEVEDLVDPGVLGREPSDKGEYPVATTRDEASEASEEETAAAFFFLDKDPLQGVSVQLT